MKKYTGRAGFLCFALTFAVAAGGCGASQQQGKAEQEEAGSGTVLRQNTEQQAEQNRAVDAQIELMNFGNTGRNIVEIPQFVTESGESTRAMEDLNAETESLQELYEKGRWRISTRRRNRCRSYMRR